MIKKSFVIGVSVVILLSMISVGFVWGDTVDIIREDKFGDWYLWRRTDPFTDEIIREFMVLPRRRSRHSTAPINNYIRIEGHEKKFGISIRVADDEFRYDPDPIGIEKEKILIRFDDKDPKELAVGNLNPYWVAIDFHQIEDFRGFMIDFLKSEQLVMRFYTEEGDVDRFFDTEGFAHIILAYGENVNLEVLKEDAENIIEKQEKEGK